MIDNFSNIFIKLDKLLEKKDKVIVAIDGKSGSGKSTLASMLFNKYSSNLFHMDDFFLTPNLRTDSRLKEAGGNVDYERFKVEVIEGIICNKEFEYKKYNCKKQAFDEVIRVIPKKLSIIEGTYSMHPMYSDYYDLKIFLTVDYEEQVKIILKRNGYDALKRFISEWIPLEEIYFDKLKIKEKSDLVYLRTSDNYIELKND